MAAPRVEEQGRVWYEEGDVLIILRQESGQRSYSRLQNCVEERENGGGSGVEERENGGGSGVTEEGWPAVRRGLR